MDQFILFLHVLGSLTVGFYLLLPFVASRMDALSPAAQAGYAKGLHNLNRIGQYLLIVQFLTGGYLISKYDLSVAWMIVVIVLFILLLGAAGMAGAPLKRIVNAGAEGGEASKRDASKAVSFSSMAAVLVILLLLLMYYPTLI